MAANSRFAVAVHALAVLAWHGERPVCSREIAASVLTNAVVIRRILGQLAHAGIVEASLGANGGFMLARPAARISLLDVYTAVGEGEFFALKHDVSRSCPVACRMNSVLEGVLSRVEAKVRPELKRTTLAHIVKELETEA
jgi:Rrf2 family protein